MRNDKVSSTISKNNIVTPWINPQPLVLSVSYLYIYLWWVRRLQSKWIIWYTVWLLLSDVMLSCVFDWLEGLVNWKWTGERKVGFFVLIVRWFRSVDCIYTYGTVPCGRNRKIRPLGLQRSLIYSIETFHKLGLRIRTYPLKTRTNWRLSATIIITNKSRTSIVERWPPMTSPRKTVHSSFERCG